MSKNHHWVLTDSLIASAARHPDKPAIVADGVSHNYAQLRDAALRVAAGLQNAGLRRHERVAIFMDNSWEAAVAIFATLLAGGVFLVVNPQTKHEKLAHILADSETAFLLAHDHLCQVVVAATAGVASLKGVFTTDGTHAYASIDDLAASPADLADPGTVPVDLAALIYTSGSTGRPKGVMMTHQSMVFTAESVTTYLRLGPDERILGVLPLAFDYGLYQLLMSVRLGATLVLERSFAFPARIVERAAAEQVTVFPGVPTIFSMLLSLSARRPFSLPSVRQVTNTAAALPPHFSARLRSIFPGALIFAMYGVTECKRVSYLEPELLDLKPTSVGKAIPGTEALVLDEAGEPCPPGQVGVLHVRGPHVMAGYWRQPERSAQVLRPGRHPGEKVLRTGDYFRTDDEGFLYFMGRSDDIIKTRGEKVSPVEVENALYGIPGVRGAAVIGVPDPVLGEAIRAYLVIDSEACLSESDVKRFCRSQLEAFMVPKEVLFVEDLPQTATGKIRKKSLEPT